MENGRSDDDIPPEVARELGEITTYRKKMDAALVAIEQRGDDEITQVDIPAPRPPQISESEVKLDAGPIKLSGKNIQLWQLALVFVGIAFALAVTAGWRPW